MAGEPIRSTIRCYMVSRMSVQRASLIVGCCTEELLVQKCESCGQTVNRETIADRRDRLFRMVELAIKMGLVESVAYSTKSLGRIGLDYLALRDAEMDSLPDRYEGS